MWWLAPTHAAMGAELYEQLPSVARQTAQVASTDESDFRHAPWCISRLNVEKIRLEYPPLADDPDDVQRCYTHTNPLQTTFRVDCRHRHYYRHIIPLV